MKCTYIYIYVRKRFFFFFKRTWQDIQIFMTLLDLDSFYIITLHIHSFEWPKDKLLHVYTYMHRAFQTSTSPVCIHARYHFSKQWAFARTPLYYNILYTRAYITLDFSVSKASGYHAHARAIPHVYGVHNTILHFWTDSCMCTHTHNTYI